MAKVPSNQSLTA